jgi:hypothetical protein
MADLALRIQGDIWSVPASGGSAIPLTLSETYEFVSNAGATTERLLRSRPTDMGRSMCFVMPAGGGESKRLTYHSAPEIPSSFTADDKSVLVRV